MQQKEMWLVLWIFMLEDGLTLYVTSYEYILCYTGGLCHDKDSNVMHFLYVKVTFASVRCVIMWWLLKDIFISISSDLGTVCRNFAQVHDKYISVFYIFLVMSLFYLLL